MGYGTFKPVATEVLEEHRVDPEEFHFPEETAAKLNAVRAAGGRIVAVGTTCVRTLESAAATGSLAGTTNMFIYPGYQFQKVGAMLTNFHFPRTSLLLLVCALAGTGFTLAAYRHAVEEKYRFFSYGDCMLIL